MRAYVFACGTSLSITDKASKIMANIKGPTGSLLIAVSLLGLAGISSTAFAEPVSVTVVSGVAPQEGATVTLTDTLTGAVTAGTTVSAGQKSPTFKTDIAPGTYKVTSISGTETGTMIYRVTVGKNEPAVFVQPGGYQNNPGQGADTIASGVTLISQVPAIAQIP